MDTNPSTNTLTPEQREMVRKYEAFIKEQAHITIHLQPGMTEAEKEMALW